VTSESGFHKTCEYFDLVPARSHYNSIEKRSILYKENKIKDLLRDFLLINMEINSLDYAAAINV